MSKNITDIANWNEEYPFLNEVWSFYNKFDIITIEDTYDHYIHPSCFMILKKYGKNIGVYNSFCTKLLKNLGHYSENTKSYIRSHDHCNILYNWIYNSKKKHTIPDEIINDCFEEYTRIGKAMKYEYKCSYDTHNRLYKEPINITLLNVFESNMENIRNILNDENDEKHIPCRKFVCKCVQIYKNMHANYCKNVDDGNNENTDNIVKKDEIPALDDDPNIYSNKCQIYLQEQASDTTVVSQDIPTSLTRTLPKGENQSSPMSSTVPTALGTVAGASSILALLYKFTPGRRWIHSGFGRQSGRINNDLYVEGPNELLFPGFESEVMSSNNTRYNIGYGSV